MILFALIVVLVVYNMFFSFQRVKEGVVISKIHQNMRKWVKDKSVTAGRYYLLLPFLHYDDEDWILVMKNDKGRVGKLFVDKETFENVKVGDIYTKKSEDKYVDWAMTRSATKEEIETFPDIEPKE